ncbi:thioesterase II family protein [Streptomyces canus]|uniref:thioesterase II family protein n=1 Tax=Streptomyces canus TaxID=58343 RepID=UPI0036832B95
MKPTRWIVRRRELPAPRLRMICFAYAGGSASVFHSWQGLLPADVEVCAVQLPGHETRMAETPLRRMDDLVPPLTRELAEVVADVPFVTFGHSLGAAVSFEFVRRLRANGGPSPEQMFVSGRRPPHIRVRERTVHDLPEDEFVAVLTRLNGTPREVLERPEVLELVLPMVRADFELSETYRYRPGLPLDCPVTAFAGLSDLGVPLADVADWARHTTGAFTLRTLPGDHFFLRSAQDRLLADIRQQLAVPRAGVARA